MVNVLYIAGKSRSGSTIFGDLLARGPHFEHFGEIHNIWRIGFKLNRLCSCGRRFSQCDFWSGVVRSGYASPDKVDADAMREGERFISRLRHVPAKKLWSAPILSNPLFNNYVLNQTKLYQAIADACPGRIIVDSSKCPYYLFALTQIRSLRLHLVHLVRDPRAVAYSYLRNRNHPDPDQKIPMKKSMPQSSAISWNRINQAIGSIQKFTGMPSILIRYEDLVATPLQTIERIFSLTGLPFPDSNPGQMDVQTEKHVIWGNPVRFQNGPVCLRLDEAWIKNMQLHHKMIVSALTWKQRSLFGY